MRTVTELYQEYRTPPWLQEHQLRVAAVGKMVAALHENIDRDAIIVSCLLHDIGAIVKFDFSNTDQLRYLHPKTEIAHWRAVQADFHAKYGDKEHPATDAILKEIGVRKEVQDIVHNTGFDNMSRIIKEGYLSAEIVQYADMRVAPDGITSLFDRLTDVRNRYAERLKVAGRYEQFEENFTNADIIERKLFAGKDLLPGDISDETAAPLIEELRAYSI